MMVDPSSPTIAFIHGDGSTHRVRDTVTEGLGAFSVSSIDLPGHLAGNGPSYRIVAGYVDTIEHNLPDGPLVRRAFGGWTQCL
jgi:pimeloyl-ACP methyl ester carboxylesterase